MKFALLFLILMSAIQAKLITQDSLSRTSPLTTFSEIASQTELASFAQVEAESRYTFDLSGKYKRNDNYIINLKEVGNVVFMQFESPFNKETSICGLWLHHWE